MTVSFIVSLLAIAGLAIGVLVFVWRTALPVPPKPKEKPPATQVMFIYPSQQPPSSPTGTQGMTGSAKLTLKS